jgi:hypothetical protein
MNIDSVLYQLQDQILEGKKEIEPELYEKCLELINQSENSSSLVELAKLQVKQAEMIKRNVQMRDKILEAKEEIGRIRYILNQLVK